MPSACTSRQPSIGGTSSSRPTISAQQKDLLKDYAGAWRKAAELGAYLASKKDEVLSIIRLLGGRAVYRNVLMFQGETVKYAYPAAIVNSEEKLRKTKKIMQLDGRAQKIVTPCLKHEDLSKQQQAVAA